MTEEINQSYPPTYIQIDEATRSSAFTMSSDVLTCSLLRTLASSKPNGKMLELGTGTGLSTSWILDGMDADAQLISIDNDENFLNIARQFLGADKRLTLVCTDGADWVNENKDKKFDYIFADTWHGKYLLLDEGLSMLNKGGLYIIDDMLPQPNWPPEHQAKVTALLDTFNHLDNFRVTKMEWASGLVLLVKTG